MRIHLGPFVLALLALAANARGQLHLVATTPAANGRIAPAGRIAMTFSAALDAATVTPHAFAVFGSWSGPAAGSLALGADQRTVTFWPARPLFAGELVTVSIARTVATPGGTQLGAGRHFQFWVTSAPGNRQFQNLQSMPLRRPGEGRIGTYGIYAGDIDGDGAPDITSMNEISNDIRLQHNSGCGTFTLPQVLPNPGQWPSPNEGCDLDRNGRIDLVTGNQNSGAVSVWRNDGNGSFLAPVVHLTAGYVHGIAVADFNCDGYDDVAAPNSSSVSVFLNQGNGTLGAAVTYDAGGNGEDNVSACDVDGDRIVDLCVGNLFSNTMGVLRGLGNGTFALLRTLGTGGQPFHQCAGDVDGDGHVDILFANRGTNTFAVLRGNGAGNFAPAVTYPVGQTPAAIEVGDLDGDGDLDCVVANYSSADYSLWWNRGDGVFEQPATLAAAQSGSCSTLVDFDRDGIVDIIGADENADLAILYRQGGFGSATSQPPSCAATFRLDQRADRAGFGPTPPQVVRMGGRTMLGVSGPDGAFGLLGLSLPYPQGLYLPGAGILGLDLGIDPWLWLIYLDARGELLLPLDVPFGLPTGIAFAFQAAIGTQTWVGSNPQAFVFAF